MNQSQLYNFYDRDPGPIVEFLDFIRDLYGLPESGSVLDMGCGPGRLLAPLAAWGWTVTGCEPDPDYGSAAEAVIRELPGARFFAGGFLDLEEAEAYDLIAGVNGPYSYLLDLASRRDAVARCARALRPDGVLFLEFANFYWIFRNYREPPVMEIEVDGTRVTRRASHEIDYHRGTFTHHDRFTWADESGVERELTKAHHMAIVSFPELAFLLSELGFRDVRTFNAFEDRHPGSLTGKRVLVAARAPLKEARAS